MLRTIPIAGAPRRRVLGAEELIELGQSSPVSVVPAAPVVPPASSSMAKIISINRDEAKLVLKVVDNLVEFSQSFPIEYHSYCPAERWEAALSKVGSWSAYAEQELARGSTSINIPSDVLFMLVDLERCVSSARDARLSSARWAFTISAVAGIADWLFKLTWLGLPAYLAGIAILYGRPLYAKYQAVPEEPFEPVLSGRRIILGSRHTMAGCTAPPESPEEAAQVKYMERVIVPEDGGSFNHYWGVLESPGAAGRPESAVCLAKGRFRIRIEGWEGDQVMPAPGWQKAVVCEPSALNTVAVWEVPGTPRVTSFGPAPERSRHEENFWVEYVGPLTKGSVRRAGPFGCPFDTRDHALEDSGIKERGRDGDFVVFDAEEHVVEVPMVG